MSGQRAGSSAAREGQGQQGRAIRSRSGLDERALAMGIRPRPRAVDQGRHQQVRAEGSILMLVLRTCWPLKVEVQYNIEIFVSRTDLRVCKEVIELL